MKTSYLLLCAATAAAPLHAQVFDPGASGPASGGGNTTIVNQQPKPANNQFLGNDTPFFDPGSETATWNGKAWNVTNNRLFRGRFEKYLAAPEDNSDQDKAYRQVMSEIIQSLTPKQGALPNLNRAVALLPVASEFPIDARLCDAIVSAIYTVWMVQKNEAAMVAANKAMEKEIDNLSMRVEVGAEGRSLAPGGGGSTGGGGGAQRQQNPNGTGNQTAQRNPPTNRAGGGAGSPSLATDVSQFTRLGIDMQKITERQALRMANVAKFGINELKSKLEFQGLIVQMFLQRRFEHVLVACRCYNYMFSGQDRELKIKEGSDVEKMFAKGLGVNPTISTLEAFASEAIRDVDEGVQAFEYLIEKSETQTASNRLGESFAIGEYLPRVRTLPRVKKEKVLEFVRDSNMLISSLEVKDFGRADELLIKLKTASKDFDDSKPRALVESARAASGLHIEAAKMAAVNQDTKKVEEEIRQAAELWPTNPEIKAFSKDLSENGNAQTRILLDFDSLLAQRNYRQIAKDAVKYGAVMVTKPDKQKQLQEVIDIVKKSETAVIKADELARSENPYGAWESVKEALKDLPDDTDLNKRSAMFSSQVSEFVQALDRAEKLEEKKQYGSSLAWFLKAERIYPGSRFAKAGIERNADLILPSSSAASMDLPPPTSSTSTPIRNDLPAPTSVAK